MSDPIEIEAPLLIMYEQDGKVMCRIHRPPDYTHKHYGLLICDAVRHVARAFKIEEDDVWDWVERERYKQSTEFTSPS